MEYAPIAIITCNRYQHLKKCIDSLSKCAYADKTELFISVDYPPSDKYRNGYLDVVSYLQSSIYGFKKVNIFFQEKNLGPELNNYFIEDKVFEVYDNIIYTEDDNIFSPNFLVYMNECLQKTKDDDMCYCVCAHKYPVNFIYGSNTVIKMNNDFDSWGYANWKDRVLSAREFIRGDQFIQQYKDIKLIKRLYSMNRKLFCYYIDNIYRNYEHTNILESRKYRTRMVDVSISIYLIFKNMYVIVPAMNKVRNEGWDGSGTNCPDGSETDWINQEIDTNKEFTYMYDKQNENSVYNTAEICKYHRIPFLQIVKRVYMYIMLLIKGVE